MYIHRDKNEWPCLGKSLRRLSRTIRFSSNKIFDPRILLSHGFLRFSPKEKRWFPIPDKDVVRQRFLLSKRYEGKSKPYLTPTKHNLICPTKIGRRTKKYASVAHCCSPLLNSDFSHRFFSLSLSLCFAQQRKVFALNTFTIFVISSFFFQPRNETVNF